MRIYGWLNHADELEGVFKELGCFENHMKSEGRFVDLSRLAVLPLPGDQILMQGFVGDKHIVDEEGAYEKWWDSNYYHYAQVHKRIFGQDKYGPYVILELIETID